MDNFMQIFLVISFMVIAIYLQIFAAKLKSTIAGLIMPMTLLLITFISLLQNITAIRNGVCFEGIAKFSEINILLHFVLYNIPTIILFCIYNYYKRQKLK